MNAALPEPGVSPTPSQLARSHCYIGLMSGTSMDGVDGVLVEWAAPASPGARAPMQVHAHAHRAMPPALRDSLMQLNQSGPDELHQAALAANALAHLQAQVVHDLLAQSGMAAGAVRAVGSHGQTVRHRPGEFDGHGYTWQLNQPALLAELCGIDVIADFRSRDVAAGGQGAPLVPAFHATVFSRPDRACAVLNIGGIANLTCLPAAGAATATRAAAADATGLRGFDCGPGNALMDHWVARHCGQPFDADGAWAAGGQVLPELLQRLMAEPFLQRLPPKSTGRDLFNAGWLAQHLAGGTAWAAQDVQATLAEFTALAAAQALQRSAPEARELLVCGGGALNGHLLRRLSAALPGVAVGSTAEAGLPPLQVEAAAFAWLAQAFTQRMPGQRPEVTGARGLRVLGALYPA